MDNIYLIIGGISVIVVATGLIITIIFTEKVENPEGENCSYDPGIKERSCCRKRAEIESRATGG